MRRANIRSGDELVKYMMVNSIQINLDVFSTLKKSRIIDKKDWTLVITLHRHDTMYWKTKLLKK